MEFNTNQINIMLDALEHYGNGPQVDMAIEEMSELTKELLVKAFYVGYAQARKEYKHLKKEKE